jgi:SRSO17 transposase
VFATYASRWGHALIDRQLYLPKARANDPDRRARAQVPEDVTFATRPAMACEMVARLLDEGTPCAFVLADAVYGSDFRFRRMLEDRGQPHVLALRPTHSLRFLEEWHLVRTDPATMIAEVPPASWQSLSTGEGTRGHRPYDWTRVPLNYMAGEGFSRWLLARRSLRDPKAVAYCFAYARTNTTLPELAAAAGLRWTIEECFLRAKDDLGPDPCEMRFWHGWYRHMTLVMAAAAFPVRLTADQRRAAFSKPNKTRPQTQMAAA